MNVYERLEAACRAKGLDPSGRELEKQMKERVSTFSRTTLSKWKTSGSSPKSEFIAALADILDVSTDYLLCRTNDPTNYTKQEPELSAKEKQLLQMFRDMTETTADDCLRYCDFLLQKQSEDKKKASESA